MHGRHRTPNTRWSLLLLLCVAQLMVILDISAVNVALPDLAKDLNIAQADIGWTITSYSLIFGSLLLLGGRAADLLGRRRVFLTGLGVFTASSLATALAADAGMLFAARAGQGLGAAMLSPAALSIITTTFHGPERAKALGVWGAVGGAGAAIGVLLGGVLTELVDWRAIFFINLPVGLALAAGATHLAARRRRAAAVARPRPARRAAGHRQPRRARLRALPGRRAAAGPRPRRSGSAPRRSPASPRSPRSNCAPPSRCCASSASATARVGGGFVMMLAASAVLFGSFLLSSLYLQNVLGTGALETGLAFLPFAVAIGAGVHAAGHLITHAGVRIPLAAGFADRRRRDAAALRRQRGRQLRRRRAARHARRRLRPRASSSSRSRSRCSPAPPTTSPGCSPGLNTTGHEIGGSLGIAILATIAAGAAGPTAAAGGIGDAFLAAAIIAGVASAAALVILPSARTFLPKLALAPRVAVH